MKRKIKGYLGMYLWDLKGLFTGKVCYNDFKFWYAFLLFIPELLLGMIFWTILLKIG